MLTLEPINIIINNRQEILTFIKEQFPFRTKDYNKCHRDLSYIINAIISDLLFDVSSYTIDVGNKFWYEVLDNKNNTSRIVYPEIRRESEIFRI